MSTPDRDPPAPEATASDSSAELEQVQSVPKVAPTNDAVAESTASAGSSSEPALAVDGAKPKKRKKKRRNASEKLQTEMRPGLDANGRERPRFLLAFPKDPELEMLIAAFESGNYARVRELAPKLIETAEEPEVQGAAREILRRVEPDPLLKLLLFVAIALFVIVVAYAYHSHA
jgi:hypothetical protein